MTVPHPCIVAATAAGWLGCASVAWAQAQAQAVPEALTTPEAIVRVSSAVGLPAVLAGLAWIAARGGITIIVRSADSEGKKP